jgi:hypothetical protein
MGLEAQFVLCCSLVDAENYVITLDQGWCVVLVDFDALTLKTFATVQVLESAIFQKAGPAPQTKSEETTVSFQLIRHPPRLLDRVKHLPYTDTLGRMTPITPWPMRGSCIHRSPGHSFVVPFALEAPRAR